MDDAPTADAGRAGDDRASGLRPRLGWSAAGGQDAVDRERHDDDALADALAEQIASVTSSIPIITPEMLRRAGSSSSDDLFAALMDVESGTAHDSAPEYYSASAAPIEIPDTEAEGPEPQSEPDVSPVWESTPSAPPAPSYGATPYSAEVPVDGFLPSEPPRYAPGEDSWHDLALHPYPSTVAEPSSDEQLDETRFAPPVALPEPAPPVSAPRPMFTPPPPSSEPFAGFPPPVASAETLAAFPPPAAPRSRPAPSERFDLSEPPPLVEPPAPPRPPSSDEMPSLNVGAFLQAAPPPSPATAVVPPPGSALPEQPRRRSLDDSALASVLDGETARRGASSALAELEIQMQLRAEDDRDFESWERALRAIGSPEATAAIDRARHELAARFSTSFSDDASSAEDAAPTIDPVPSPPDVAGAGQVVDDAVVDAVPFLDDRDADVGDIDESDRAWLADAGVDLDVDVEATPIASPSIADNPFPVPPPAPAPHDDAPVLEVLVRQRVFAVESNDGEPTLLEYRAGRAARMFWQWFAVNSSIVSVALGAVLFGLGLSVRQALVAALAGVALSLLPLGLATLAGKWSGQPTMIVSRAAFGIVGNLVPAILAVVTRVFWGGAVLWIVAAGVSAGVESAGLAVPSWLAFAVIGAALVLATAVAVFGYALLIRFAIVLGVVSAALIAGMIALTAPSLDFSRALSAADGSWAHAITGALLVFSVIGLAWASSGAEVARYQRPGGSGSASMAWAMAGTAVPALVLLGYGVLLASSDADLAVGLQENPIAAIGALLPSWYPIPLTAALVLGLLCGAVLTIYSGAFSLQSAGVTVRRPAAVIVIAVLVGLAAAALVMATGDIRMLFVDVATTIAVPVAAWVGIFTCDLLIRNERFNGAALMRRGGVYGNVNWVNLTMLVVATGIGFGFTSASLAGLEWQGYLWSLAGVANDAQLATSDLGVIVALVLGLLTPLLAGIPRIRRQERASH